MIFLRRILAFAIAIAALEADIGLAGSGNGIISNISIRHGDYALLSVVGGTPSCTRQEFVVPLGTAAGKAMYALALYSQMSSRPIGVVGKGGGAACLSLDGLSYEEVWYLYN